ncbi:MAG: type II toxin-antitoxin system PemK/MazF family toxin [Candidatus Eremiobacterota bacterium]
MNYKQGDIVLVWFPDSNLLTAKKRPAIILQRDNLQTGLDQVIIGMITSNVLRSGHGSRIFIDISTETGKKTGLMSNSVIMSDNIVTVQQVEIYKQIGIFSDIDLLKKSIKYTLGI